MDVYADADLIKEIHPEDKNTTVLRNVGEYPTTQDHVKERVIHQRAKFLHASYRTGTAPLLTCCRCQEQLSVVANNMGNKTDTAWVRRFQLQQTAMREL